MWRVLGFLASAAVLSVAVDRAWADLNLPAPLVGSAAGSTVSVPSAATVPPRVLLVVIDGLRADVAERLPFLARLADAGSRARTVADPPTISAPQYVALLAGVPPRDSGVRTNSALRAAGVDDVARRERDAGLHTAAFSTGVDWWQRLFPESFESGGMVPASRCPLGSGILRAPPGRQRAQRDVPAAHQEAAHTSPARPSGPPPFAGFSWMNRTLSRASRR